MNIKTFYDSFPQAVRIVLSNGKSFPAVEVCESFEKNIYYFYTVTDLYTES